jgi:hypothetical protein
VPPRVIHPITSITGDTLRRKRASKTASDNDAGTRAVPRNHPPARHRSSATSCRNPGRHHLGIPGRLHRNLHPVGRQAREIEVLKGASRNALRTRSATTSVISPMASPCERCRPMVLARSTFHDAPFECYQLLGGRRRVAGSRQSPERRGDSAARETSKQPFTRRLQMGLNPLWVNKYCRQTPTSTVDNRVHNAPIVATNPSEHYNLFTLLVS